MNNLRFGYYKVGNDIVFSKIEALELADRKNSPISWHYNDDVFDSIDWKIEPKFTLSEIYKLRAQQIRKSYDYIVLFYSGGADSHNMLESFLHADVKIDEIVSFHSYDADKDVSSEFNKEIFTTAVPYVKKCKTEGRLDNNTPHRLVEMGDIISRFNKAVSWSNFSYYFNSSPTINNVARAFLREYIDEYKVLISQGKKVGFIWGHDKPRIMHTNGKFFLHFMDIFDNCVSTWIQQNNPAGWFDEMFYSTPDMPELIVKQAHTIKNFLNISSDSHPWVTELVTGLGHVIKNYPDDSWKAFWLTQDGQSALIYPWFRDDLYYAPKYLNYINGPRDEWFWKDKEASSNYNKVIESVILKFGNKWLRSNEMIGLKTTKNFTSKKYWLE